jgi:hypothetical protein
MVERIGAIQRESGTNTITYFGAVLYSENERKRL